MTSELLTVLRRHANHRGTVITREAKLLQELQCSQVTLRSALRELEDRQEVRVLSPLPYLVVALSSKSWSGGDAEPPKMGRKTGPEALRSYSFQSSLSQSQQLMKESYRQPTAEEALLREILDTLGESDATTFRGALRSYEPAIIRTALERVRRMKTIRKNRTALFRYLLPRIAQEPRFRN